MTRLPFLMAMCCLSSFAFAQTAQLGDSAKGVLGTWEFSNANREKVCSVTFNRDPARVGFKVEFDRDCVTLFPLIADVVGWDFPENDLLHLLNAQGKALVEFSEVESGIYEAPTPGVGVLFLQNAADAGVPGRKPDELAGDWALVRGAGPPLCTLTLTATAERNDLALAVKSPCDPAVARANFQSWQIDRDELVLYPARGNAWRFEEVEKGTWRRVPQGTDPILLVRQ